VKLLVDEPETAPTAQLWIAAERRISSRLLYPETRAALAAALRAARIDRSQLDQARSQLEDLWQSLDETEVTRELARRAGDLAERLALRGYDAVHLATAEAVLDADGVLAAADTRLAAAARVLGLPVANL
jgi:uncharacterized protein